MRLFLALELPESVRAALREAAARLALVPPAWKPVRAEALHVTIRFLGEVAPARDAELRAEWRAVAAAHAPFRLRTGAVGAFPARGRARVAWCAVEEPGPPAALAADVERAARAAGFVPERRRFRPHVTLARARRDARPARPGTEGASRVEAPRVDAPGFDVEALTLFRSALEPEGARYTVLDRFPLLGRRGTPDRSG